MCVRSCTCFELLLTHGATPNRDTAGVLYVTKVFEPEVNQASSQSINSVQSAHHRSLIQQIHNLAAIYGQGKFAVDYRKARGAKKSWLWLAHMNC